MRAHYERIELKASTSAPRHHRPGNGNASSQQFELYPSNAWIFDMRLGQLVNMKAASPHGRSGCNQGSTLTILPTEPLHGSQGAPSAPSPAVVMLSLWWPLGWLPRSRAAPAWQGLHVEYPEGTKASKVLWMSRPAALVAVAARHFHCTSNWGCATFKKCAPGWWNR